MEKPASVAAQHSQVGAALMEGPLQVYLPYISPIFRLLIYCADERPSAGAGLGSVRLDALCALTTGTAAGGEAVRGVEGEVLRR